MTDPSKARAGAAGFGGKERNPAADNHAVPGSRSVTRRWSLLPGSFLGQAPALLSELTPQLSARLLYEYCVASEKKVSETVHNLFIIAEHYAVAQPEELENPEIINGIPPFFTSLTAEKKAAYCYNQVTEALSLEAMPVTVESLRATKRGNPNDPWSSYAGRFVQRVTGYVILSLLVMLGLYLLLYKQMNLFATDSGGITAEGIAIQWIAFGCIGALVHLLNHALTATRLKTFEVSEARKIRPRLLLGGMFGFVVPWVLALAGLPTETVIPAGSVAAFLGGYSVRFSIGLLERMLAALLPETKPGT